MECDKTPTTSTIGSANPANAELPHDNSATSTLDRPTATGVLCGRQDEVKDHRDEEKGDEDDDEEEYEDEYIVAEFTNWRDFTDVGLQNARLHIDGLDTTCPVVQVSWREDNTTSNAEPQPTKPATDESEAGAADALKSADVDTYDADVANADVAKDGDDGPRAATASNAPVDVLSGNGGADSSRGREVLIDGVAVNIDEPELRFRGAWEATHGASFALSLEKVPADSTCADTAPGPAPAAKVINDGLDDEFGLDADAPQKATVVGNEIDSSAPAPALAASQQAETNAEGAAAPCQTQSQKKPNRVVAPTLFERLHAPDKVTQEYRVAEAIKPHRRLLLALDAPATVAATLRKKRAREAFDAPPEAANDDPDDVPAE